MGTSGVFIWAGRGREREEAEKKGSEQHFCSWLIVIKQYVFYSSNTPPQIGTKARSLNCNSAFVPVCHCSLSPERMRFQLFILKKEMKVCFCHSWPNKRALLRAHTVSDMAN